MDPVPAKIDWFRSVSILEYPKHPEMKSLQPFDGHHGHVKVVCSFSHQVVRIPTRPHLLIELQPNNCIVSLHQTLRPYASPTCESSFVEVQLGMLKD